MGRCPCCGGLVEDVPIDELLNLSLSQLEHNIIQLLIDAYPRKISAEYVVDNVYKNKPDGGPLWARQSVANTIIRMRKKLRTIGWTVSKGQAGRGGISSWKLMRCEVSKNAA